jgi:hypothetical protein
MPFRTGQRLLISSSCWHSRLIRVRQVHSQRVGKLHGKSMKLMHDDGKAIQKVEQKTSRYLRATHKNRVM